MPEAGLERFLPLLPPQGKGRSELMGAYDERLRTTDRLGVTRTPTPLPPLVGERLRCHVHITSGHVIEIYM